MTAGMRARRVAPLNFEAPLQPVEGKYHVKLKFDKLEFAWL